MKANPQLLEFIENKIPENDEVVYIIYEEGDLEAIQTLIKQTASNKDDIGILLRRIEQNKDFMHNDPFAFLNDSVLWHLRRRRKSSGLLKVEKTLYALFPNYSELRLIAHLSKRISNYQSALRGMNKKVTEYYEFLDGEENPFYPKNPYEEEN